jgi:hypothetical protein
MVVKCTGPFPSVRLHGGDKQLRIMEICGLQILKIERSLCFIFCSEIICCEKAIILFVITKSLYLILLTFSFIWSLCYNPSRPHLDIEALVIIS